MRQSEILAVLGVLSVVLVAVEAEEQRTGRRLRPAEYSREELDFFIFPYSLHFFNFILCSEMALI